jgi:hypothetical protein
MTVLHMPTLSHIRVSRIPLVERLQKLADRQTVVSPGDLRKSGIHHQVARRAVDLACSPNWVVGCISLRLVLWISSNGYESPAGVSLTESFVSNLRSAFMEFSTRIPMQSGWPLIVRLENPR